MPFSSCRLAAWKEAKVEYELAPQVYSGLLPGSNTTLRLTVVPEIDVASTRMSPWVRGPAPFRLLMLSPTTELMHPVVPSRLMPAVGLLTTVLPTKDSPAELLQSRPWSPLS